MNFSWFEESQGLPGWTYLLMGVVLVILLSTLTLRQVTSVAEDGVTVRFGFLYRTRIAFAEIARAEAVSYQPIREYGGWGIRGLGRRRALNMRGNLGVLLTRRDGSTLLVGSQKPRELLAAIARGGVLTEDKIPIEVRDF
ncbi:MAG TPA: hypothetical protein VGH97_18240 [Thermoanaerobaculia bacterium]|jgi:hypothetical protein